VLARIANPQSKRASVLNLEENFGIKLDLSAVYRMMDKITDQGIEKLNKVAYNNTKSLFKDKIDVIYFDATTLYFESFTEDDFKKNGYSKDNKHNQPQVVLALMVTKEGLPVGYKTFKGDTFDGHTLLPSLQDVKQYYDLDKVVYVADAGMFNKTNLNELEKLSKKGITYIVGARIKNMTKQFKDKITNPDNYRYINDDLSIATFDYDNKRLIVTYSKKRAKKDRYEREKNIEKLLKRLDKEKSLKGFLSHNGYKKYIETEEQKGCSPKITINEDKIKEDEIWDGLKGIITNNKEIDNQEAISQYANLWQVEESFRITKHDLKIRPIYHWKKERIKAHIAISFMAYTLIRHLEHRVRLQYKKLSPEKIRQTLLSVQASILHDKKTDRRYVLPSNVPLDAKKIYRLMDVSLKTSVYRI
jgi:transposase